MGRVKRKKQFINNRDGKKISVVIEKPLKSVGLAFIMHGQGGFKEEPHIRTYARAFLEHDITVVTFDARHTLGESEGTIEDFTTTSFLQDLEDVIDWASRQNWYHEPFVLAGHSAGSMCITLYAEQYPEKVRALVPTSLSVSGRLFRDTLAPELVSQWQQTGWLETPSSSKPGVMKRIKYAAMEDVLQYDTLALANRLTMPVLLIVGEDDTSTPPKTQQLFYSQLPGKRELHIIKGAPHTFCQPEHLQQVNDIMKQWIGRL